jgi:transcriptional regulator with XRE-family HTH domain
VTDLLKELAAHVRAEKDKPAPDPWLIRVAREARGLTGEQLAVKMGLQPSSRVCVSRWETYRGKIGAETLARLVKALDVKEADLCSAGNAWTANSEKYRQFRESDCRTVAEWLSVQGSL